MKTIWKSMSKGKNTLIRKRLANAYLSSVISISLVLFLVGVAGLLLVNTKSVSDYFKENMKVSVIMKSEVSENKALSFGEKVGKLPFVKGVEFISKEQGEKEMSNMLGDDFLKVFKTSPIPISLDLMLKAGYVSEDSLKVISTILYKNPEVDEVSYQKSLVDSLNANLRKISLFIGIFIVLLLFISFVLINSVIRLSIYDKRFNIHTMKLVGATRAFIRTPFLVQSVFLGIFSAFIAILMLIGGLYFIRAEFVQLFSIFRLDLLLSVIGIVFVCGVLICILSTYFVVNKLVSLGKDDLYY